MIRAIVVMIIITQQLTGCATTSSGEPVGRIMSAPSGSSPLFGLGLAIAGLRLCTSVKRVADDTKSEK